MYGIGPWNLELRNWQERGFLRFNQHTGSNFLVVATPGAGKTKFALKIIHTFLSEGSAERVVVVCPTEHLKTQWAGEAHKIGIELNPAWANGQGSEKSESKDFRGVVVTYQQIAANPAIHRRNCLRPTLVILDEVHHAGEGSPWGNSLREAFDPAVFRLLLSGTPFRHNNEPIPYVTYENGLSRADFSYTYGDALADNVCRPVLFPSFEGQMEWLSNGEMLTAKFCDELGQAQAAERLRTALSYQGEWIKDVIQRANNKLTFIRQNGHTEAGGLVIAMDQAHAKGIAMLIGNLTGELPVLVISDEGDSSKKIEAFKESRERWIVAVKMVSEGIDIPRLRVGIYATNITAPLFFRQAVGRFVRCVEGLEEQSAYLFIPREECLIGYAQEIKKERDHQLEEQCKKLEKERLEGSGKDRKNGFFMPISSIAEESDVIFDENLFPQDELEQAKQIGIKAGFPDSIPYAMIARALREHTIMLGRTSQQHKPQQEVKPTEDALYERKKKLSRTVARMANQLAHLLDIEHPIVHRQLIDKVGVRQEDATEEQMHEKIKLLTAWLEEAKRGGRPVFTK